MSTLPEHRRILYARTHSATFHHSSFDPVAGPYRRARTSWALVGAIAAAAVVAFVSLLT